jgi:hypothetical protein
MGGAVYVSSGANLTVNGTAFSFDSASMGLAGPGGTGGSGGDSAWELVPPGTPYGAGADGGGTGSPGMALGGAIYNARTSRLPARRSATTRRSGTPAAVPERELRREREPTHGHLQYESLLLA